MTPVITMRLMCVLPPAGLFDDQVPDLAAVALPSQDEPRKPARGAYAHPRTRA